MYHENESHFTYKKHKPETANIMFPYIKINFFDNSDIIIKWFIKLGKHMY